MRAGWRIGLYLAAVISFAALTAPAGLLLSPGRLNRLGLSAESIDGTLYNARVEGARVNGRMVGDIRLTPRLGDLVQGKWAYTWQLMGKGISGAGNIRLAQGSWAIDSAQIAADISYLAHALPVDGKIDIRIGELALTPESCRADGLTLKTGPLEGHAAGTSWPLPPLEGEARCDGHRLVMNLQGSGGDKSISIDAAIDGSFWAQSRVRIQARSAQIGEALAALGFVRAADAYELQL